jgi:phosphonopyruvate decarboxylase
MSHPLDADATCTRLQDAGVDLFAGVPCSITEPLRAVAAARGRYVPCTIEGEAVALLAGAWLAGVRGAALLQSSGLGHAINPLSTLCLPYGIPVPLVISWRGEPDTEDALHHRPMGEALPGVLSALDIPAAPLRAVPDVTARARALFESRACAAWLLSRGDLTPFSAPPTPHEAGQPASTAARVFAGGSPLQRDDVVAALAARVQNDACVSTTGYLSRALATHALPGAFYMQGSMGFALAIGAGIAHVRPAHAVTVIDGDGALLMRLGGLATVGALAPRKLTHVVVDNGAYASTGGQPVPGATDFARAALACGYRRAARCSGADGLADALTWLDDSRASRSEALTPSAEARSASVGGDGPTLLHVDVARATDTREQAPPRPTESPREIADRVRAHLAERA